MICGGYARQVLRDAARFQLVHSFAIFALLVSEKLVPCPLAMDMCSLGRWPWESEASCIMLCKY